MVVKNREILLKQKNEWNNNKTWKEEFHKHRDSSHFVNRIHAESFIERTITGKKENPDKVIISKTDFEKVERTVNTSRQAQFISERELQDERKENKKLKNELDQEKQQTAYWRDAWDELNEKVEKSFKPLVRKLEKFRDWSIEKFEQAGYKRENLVNSFEQDMEAGNQQKQIQRRRNSFDLER